MLSFYRQDVSDLALESYICDHEYRQPHQIPQKYVRACGCRVQSTDGLCPKRSWKQSWSRTCHELHISTSEIFPRTKKPVVKPPDCVRTVREVSSPDWRVVSVMLTGSTGLICFYSSLVIGQIASRTLASATWETYATAEARSSSRVSLLMHQVFTY